MSSEHACLADYDARIRAAGDWLLRSIEKGEGGSSAHWSPVKGWSQPYPETTGYIIPTLLKLADHFDDKKYTEAAIRAGNWLLDIQLECGAWQGGLYPGRNAVPSVFNTGQILKGMAALYRSTGNERFLNAGGKAASWLSGGIGADGLWPPGDYRSSRTPSYYTHVAWPMLEIWALNGDEQLKDNATRFLDAVLARRADNGVIAGWGFEDEGSAFTHTIAYTIRGFQESARLLSDYERYAEPMEQALEFFIRKSEFRNGRLPGEFDHALAETGSYVCLTGNAQLAICLLLMEQQAPDLRVVNAAAKLVDYVSSTQVTRLKLPGLHGGIAGSWPVWGRYMVLRYPNWAAKYYCDAVLMLLARMRKEF